MNFIIFIKRPCKGLFLFFLFSNCLSSELSLKPFISKINYLGINKTQNFVIDREIRHPKNSYLDSMFVEEDKARLNNLGLFSDISWSIVPLEDGTFILQYIFIETVQEIPITILPYYNIETGWSIRGGWLINNYRGRNQTLGIIGSFGGLNTYGLKFKDPWIFGNHISFGLNLTKAFYSHIFLNKAISSNSGSIAVGKWFRDKIKTNAVIKIENKEFSNDEKISFHSFIPEVSISYDSRDLYWNPGKGINFFNSIVYSIDYKNNSYSNLIWKQSYSLYHDIFKLRKKIILACNITFYKKWKGKEEVRKLSLGDAYSIRGWSLPDYKIYSNPENSFRFGHEYFIGSIEMRKVLIEKFVTRYGVEAGLTMVAFFDFGRIGDNWSNLKDQETIAGSGLGIRIPIPLFDAIRFDLGWGLRKKLNSKPIFHFALMQKF